MIDVLLESLVNLTWCVSCHYAYSPDKVYLVFKFSRCIITGTIMKTYKPIKHCIVLIRFNWSVSCNDA